MHARCFLCCHSLCENITGIILFYPYTSIWPGASFTLTLQRSKLKLREVRELPWDAQL